MVLENIVRYYANRQLPQLKTSLSFLQTNIFLKKLICIINSDNFPVIIVKEICNLFISKYLQITNLW